MLPFEFETPTEEESPTDNARNEKLNLLAQWKLCVVFAGGCCVFFKCGLSGYFANESGRTTGKFEKGSAHISCNVSGLSKLSTRKRCFLTLVEATFKAIGLLFEGPRIRRPAVLKKNPVYF